MRLIDANAYAAEMKTRQDACKEILYAAEKDGNDEVYDRMNCAFGVFVEAKLTLDAMPTIDAVPVVRCEWIPDVRENKRGYFQLYGFTCSKCRCVVSFEWNYCPNCGAKMDGKEKTE